MELKITIYKESGKYYTDEVIKHKKDLQPWSEEYREFLKSNLPATCNDGYIVVEDASEEQSFHNALYKYEDLFKERIPYNKIGE